MTSQNHSITDSRIAALEPTIARIASISGTPGLSISIALANKPVHAFSVGSRSLSPSLLVDEHTIFPLGTLAKTFTASAIAHLVSTGKLSWTTSITQILPDLEIEDAAIRENLNVVDLLVMRAGIGRSNYWWQGSNGELLLRKEDLVKFYGKLGKTGHFRAEWGYSNFGYALLGAVIETLSGLSFAEYVQTSILDPLGMKDTTFKAIDVFDESKNAAKPYGVLEDGSFLLLPQPQVNGETIMGPAMGGASSAHDLQIYAQALLESHDHDKGKTKGKEPILKSGLKHLSGHIFTTNSTLEKSYAFGFYRSQLPATVLGMGWNSLYVKAMPVLKPKGHVGPLIAHGGSLPGYHSSIALLPEIGASVVVCTNSIALGDVSGWASLAAIEALIESPAPSDYISLATEAAGNAVKNVENFTKKLEDAKTSNTKSRALEQYVGTYRDESHDWTIVIRKKGDSQLEILFQGLESQAWSLSHYEHDTFSWLASREEQLRRSRMTTYPLVPTHFKIIFKANSENNIDRLCWPHEAGVPADKQEFVKAKG